MLDLPLVKEQKGPFGYQNLISFWLRLEKHDAHHLFLLEEIESYRGREEGKRAPLLYLEPSNPDARNLGRASLESTELPFLGAF